MKTSQIGLLLSVGSLLFWGALWGAEAPSIRSLLKANVYQRVTEEREVMVYASLKDEESPNRYSFYATMGVRASVEQVRKILTDYPLYVKLIPYVDRAQYEPTSRILKIAGGIWKFRLDSMVRIEEKSPRWIQYEVVGGHFTGLKGNMFMESLGEKGTLVYFEGEVKGSQWPPRFVIERGAEIVFGFTGQKMRSYIESQKKG